MSDFVEFLENYGTGGDQTWYGTSVCPPLLGLRRSFWSHDPVTHGRFFSFLENYKTGGAQTWYATSVGAPLLGLRKNFRSRDLITRE